MYKLYTYIYGKTAGGFQAICNLTFIMCGFYRRVDMTKLFREVKLYNLYINIRSYILLYNIYFYFFYIIIYSVVLVYELLRNGSKDFNEFLFFIFGRYDNRT